MVFCPLSGMHFLCARLRAGLRVQVTQQASTSGYPQPQASSWPLGPTSRLRAETLSVLCMLLTELVPGWAQGMSGKSTGFGVGQANGRVNWSLFLDVLEEISGDRIFCLKVIMGSMT